METQEKCQVSYGRSEWPMYELHCTVHGLLAVGIETHGAVVSFGRAHLAVGKREGIDAG